MATVAQATREAAMDFWTEVRAGTTTFLTMAYILAANAFFLTQAGVPAEVAVVGTAWAAAIGSIVMGLLTNTPFAMAPGMGLNAALAFGVILGLGVSWQVGMGLLVLGLALIMVLRRVWAHGAILGSILITTIVAVVIGATPTPTSLFQAPKLPYLIGAGDVVTVLLTPALYASVFAFFMADFFDTLGTGVAISKQGGFFDRLMEGGTLRRFLSWDALAAAVSGFFSASSTTTYIESGAGVAEGGRYALSSIVTGLWFLASLALVPVALVVANTPGATGPALIAVGVLMLGILAREVDWSNLNLEMWVAILLTVLVMPLTKSISPGIGAGIIAYVVLSVVLGRRQQVSGLMYLAAAAFLASYFV